MELPFFAIVASPVLLKRKQRRRFQHRTGGQCNPILLSHVIPRLASPRGSVLAECCRLCNMADMPKTPKHPQTTEPRPKVNANVNTEYFHGLLRDRQISLRGLAKKIPIEPGALSLTFSGGRNMKLHEASAISMLLGVPLREVIANAGVEDVHTGERTIPIVGELRGGNVATFDVNAPGERVAGPPDLPEVAYAVLANTAFTELAAIDGWMFFIGQPQDDPRNLIGRSVFAKPVGEDAAVYGYLSRSHKHGMFNIRHHTTQVRESVELDWAAPVLWIRPQ